MMIVNDLSNDEVFVHIVWKFAQNLNLKYKFSEVIKSKRNATVDLFLELAPGYLPGFLVK
jgi:hypothetical protein